MHMKHLAQFYSTVHFHTIQIPVAGNDFDILERVQDMKMSKGEADKNSQMVRWNYKHNKKLILVVLLLLKRKIGSIVCT